MRQNWTQVAPDPDGLKLHGLKQPTSPKTHQDNFREIDSAERELRASQCVRKSSADVTEISPYRHKAVTSGLLRSATTHIQGAVAVLAPCCMHLGIFAHRCRTSDPGCGCGMHKIQGGNG